MVGLANCNDECPPPTPTDHPTTPTPTPPPPGPGHSVIFGLRAARLVLRPRGSLRGAILANPSQGLGEVEKDRKEGREEVNVCLA